MSRVTSSKAGRPPPVWWGGGDDQQSDGRVKLQERMEEIKQNGTSGSILDDGYYGNLLRGGGNTDSDWDILVAGKRAPKKKKASPRKPPSRLDRVKTNIDLMINSSENEEDNLSRSGSLYSFYSGASK